MNVQSAAKKKLNQEQGKNFGKESLGGCKVSLSTIF